MLDASLCRRALFIAVLPWALACSDDDSPGTRTGSNVAADAGPAGSDAAVSHADGTDPLPPLPDDVALPIVFVHGFAGSAQQFQSQAMRYVANGYPQERLRAFEHDGAGGVIPEFLDGLDAMIDEVRAKYSVDKVYLIGHSRGTTVSSMYLSDSGHADKVAKYVSLDGAGCGDIPVPCVAPHQTINTRGVQTDELPGQTHVEVATSKESFVVQFNFLFGHAPDVVDIVEQRAPVVISGRAVNFPANTGRDGSTLQFWELDAQTGKRAGDSPKASFDIGADGNWGPLTVDPAKHYEQVLLSQDGANAHHFYSQPFVRSTQFVRLLSGPPDSDTQTHTNVGDDHAAFILIRMREWTTDDSVDVGTKSDSGDQDSKNVITSDITNNPISVFLQDDAATPAESTLALLPWFPMQPFETGVDLFIPANDTPNGTVTLVSKPRGASDRPQTLHVPNWASSKHIVSVMFNDYPQE
jgi:pimeloyl-ACP methyl ester carboxylesterase